MKFKKIDENKKTGQTTYSLEGINPVIANTLRRAIIDEVPTMAIEDVEIKKNESALYDEIIAHRLGLVPLKTDLKGYDMPMECKCKGEGCPKCTVTFTLKKKGPGLVYAGDLKSSDPKIKPAYKDIIIAKLLKDQEIELQATAILGKGKDHAKFSPALVFYRYKPIIKIKKANHENAKKCANVCPEEIFDFKSGKLSVNKKKEIKCTLCEACSDECPECVEIKGDENNILFSIESWGQLDDKTIIKTALDEIGKKSDELLKQIK